MSNRVLIVDDEESIVSSLSGILEDEGFKPEGAKTLREALEKLKRVFFPVVVLDVWMPDGDGVDFIDVIKEVSPDSVIIVITGHGNTQTAVKAIKKGAYEFLEKPFSLERFLLTVRHAFEAYEESRRIEEEIEFIGEHPKILEIKRLIPKIAKSKAPVLITGESGTGKEIVARLIHKHSGRKGNFVDLNCATIPAELAESELFGHEKGAFTGALSRKKGKLELADGGTLFLDEVGELDPRVQPKLLRVLESGSFTRLGGTQTIEVDARVISATNKDLEKLVREGKFREDLFWRLSVISIELPPLRERGTDVLLLAEHFLKRFCSEYKKECCELSEDAKEYLLSRPWKGNVRELKNLIERAVILCEGGKITPQALGYGSGSYRDLSYLLEIKELKKAKREFEKLFIEQKLKENNYDLKKTAKELGIDLSNLYRKLKSYGIKAEA
ncbi:MAG: sigma-54-dependent Fis family transcriptional regulator [Aquificae bacterium]|nr:sigma-54-dependent Fis family transcriptional regulator [Aquificota bacterium]